MRKREGILPACDQTTKERTRDTSSGLKFEGENNLHDVLEKTGKYKLYKHPKVREWIVFGGEKEAAGRLFKQREFLTWLTELKVDANKVTRSCKLACLSANSS